MKPCIYGTHIWSICFGDVNRKLIELGYYRYSILQGKYWWHKDENEHLPFLIVTHSQVHLGEWSVEWSKSLIWRGQHSLESPKFDPLQLKILHASRWLKQNIVVINQIPIKLTLPFALTIENRFSDVYSRIRTGVIPTTTQKDQTPHIENRNTVQRVIWLIT